MAEPHPDIQSILAALASQRPPSSTPTQTPPAAPGQAYPAPPGGAQPTHYQPPPPGVGGYGGPSAQPLPTPASSGNVDLSAIRPVNSGTMNFDDVISKARAFAAEKGITSYDRPLVYGADSRNPDRPYRRSRSRSPPRGEYHNPNNHSYRDDRRGGQGREYGGGRDRSYSPPNRGRTFSPRGAGSGRERSPIRGGDDNSETIQIESSLVGLIIGRQGENLRRIEADTNCRVQFLAATDGGPFRQCKITGPRPRRADVKTAINRIIEDSGMGALNRAQEKPRDPNRGGAAALRDGEDHMQIMVPDRTVGLIIGRGGETIRDLQERSGCHINIVGESKSVNGLRPVNLIGSREAAARAKDFIMEIVDSDSRGDGPASGTKKPPAAARPEAPPRDFGGVSASAGPGAGAGGPDKINDSVYVPSDAVGMIIGKGGETIREMQNTTGCKINVAQSSGPGEVQREIALIGSRDSIARAKQAIDEKVEAVRQKSGGSGGGGGGGGGRPARGHHDLDRPSNNYSHQGPDPTNQPPQVPSGDGQDPYAQYGGYQNYVALWYQSLMYQQQQGGQGAPAGAPTGAPPPGAQ
ncbi:Far upstream element-binding 3-like protein [Cladobotryum mycophilum]|uniref:Far upstream element-binding 3-like protein n=1 Tax=Cladobotryum mycophilum TaxID=491253 RepID=A0ABR0S917_9HYPO